MPESEEPLSIRKKELLAQTENTAVERVQTNDGEYIIKHNLSEPERSVSIIDFEEAGIGPESVGTSERELSIDSSGDVIVPEATQQDVIERAQRIDPYLYERSCGTPVYRDHGAAGITFEFTPSADKYSKDVLSTALCTAVVASFSGVPVGALPFCQATVAYILNRESPEGAWTSGFMDRDSGGFISTPYITLGITGGWDADASTWKEVSVEPFPGLPSSNLDGAHMSPHVHEMR